MKQGGSIVSPTHQLPTAIHIPFRAFPCEDMLVQRSGSLDKTNGR